MTRSKWVMVLLVLLAICAPAIAIGSAPAEEAVRPIALVGPSRCEVTLRCPLCGKQHEVMREVRPEVEIQARIKALVEALTQAQRAAEEAGNANLVTLLEKGQILAINPELKCVDLLAGTLATERMALQMHGNESLPKLVLVAMAAARDLETAMLRAEDYCGARQCQWTKRLEAEHSDWGRVICVLIGQHRIRIGMTRAQVRESYGSPSRTNRTVGRWGVHEQWVYEYNPLIHPFVHANYVYFRDGILTSWQD